MKTLILDASYKQKVALIENGKLVLALENTSPKADLFMAIIDKLLKSTNTTVDDISQICVNIGPGSFTGIRVAVSIAKGLGATKKIDYVEFTSFDYFEKNSNIVLTGFSNFVYVKNAKGEMDCVDISTLETDCEYIVCEKMLQEKLEKLNVKSRLVEELPFDKIDAIVSGKPISSSEIRPLYLRKSQAEIQRENKLKGQK